MLTKTCNYLALAIAMGILGCQAPRYTSFAPFDARLEATLRGGAMYLVMINTSGRELHNFKFSASLINENSTRAIGGRTAVRQMVASGASLKPDAEIRFHPIGKAIQDPIMEPVSRMELIGHCDEGEFRQGWQTGENGQLVPVGWGPSDK